MADQITATDEEITILSEILKAIRQVKHGHIQLVLQDSKVVQIDKTEKVRLTSSRSSRFCDKQSSQAD